VPEQSKGKLLSSVLWRGKASNRFLLSDWEGLGVKFPRATYQ